MGRKPRDQAIKALDQMVELIEATDLMIKQFDTDGYQVQGEKPFSAVQKKILSIIYRCIWVPSSAQQRETLLAFYAGLNVLAGINAE